MRSNGLIGKRNGWVDRNERDLNEEDGVRSAALAEIAELARKDDVGANRRAARASWRLMIERDLVFGKAAVACAFADRANAFLVCVSIPAQAAACVRFLARAWAIISPS